MRSLTLFFVSLFFLPALAVDAKAAAPLPDQKVRAFINLLDYVGKDYPNAVQDNKIINEAEYKEMVDFSRQISELYAQLKGPIDHSTFDQLDDDIAELQQLIKRKAPVDSVSAVTAAMRADVLSLHLVKVTPQHWPNLQKGSQVYQAQCQSCHGAKGAGNGPLAPNLEPAPTNFRDAGNAAKLSPLQAYNTIRLGLEGTAMRSFPELSDQEVWDVAFYINSLSFGQIPDTSGRQGIRKALKDTLSLAAISTMTNDQWKQLLADRGITADKGMAFVRGLSGDPNASGAGSSLDKALTLLKKAEKAYRDKEYDAALTYSINAYLDGVEPEENAIRASNAGLVKQIESKMMSVRSIIRDRVPADEFSKKVQAATIDIQEAQNILENQDYSFWLNFLLAGSILLREGLEAFLIIMIILSVLRSVGAERATKFVHSGWVIALLVGIGGWFLVQSLIEMNSMQRELMEGIGALIAVVMLLYIGFWMHSKTHASQWTRFIKEKIHRLLDEENMWGLALLSFIVVFREAFESILFLSSISMKSTTASNAGILLALITVAIVIAALGYIYQKVTKKIPIRQLFRYSSLMLAILAFILIGKGVHSLAEAGYLNISSLPIDLSIPMLGFYPTWQTVLAQIVILFVIAGLWYYSNRLGAPQRVKSG